MKNLLKIFLLGSFLLTYSVYGNNETKAKQNLSECEKWERIGYICGLNLELKVQDLSIGKRKSTQKDLKESSDLYKKLYGTKLDISQCYIYVVYSPNMFTSFNYSDIYKEQRDKACNSK